jgi:hypothetical protein
LHWTTHVVVGAAAGYLVGNPVPAAVLGFASHPVLDLTPHYDPDSEVGYVLDAAAGCAALALIAANGAIRRTDRHRAALWGAVGSALPDLELLVKLVDRDFEAERYVFPWHNGRLPHRQTHFMGSTTLQVALILVMLRLIALKVKKKRLTQA